MKKILYIFLPCILILFPSCEEEEENTSPDSLIGTTWVSDLGCDKFLMVFDSNTSFQWWVHDCTNGEMPETPEYHGSPTYLLSNNILYISNDRVFCDYCPVSYTASYNGESIIINEVIDPYHGGDMVDIPGGVVFIQE